LTIDHCSFRQQAVHDILSGRRQGVFAAMLRATLLPASGLYAAAMRLRRWMYRRHFLPAGTAEVPVISVGNLTTGGTGKTPMVAWIVRQLQAAERRPAILIRGYKASADGASDEADLLRMLCDVPVLVQADRLAGAQQAVAQGADVLVLDDGFQHCRLQRDLDIVLIDATRPFGYGYCLPRGLLREPPTALRDADVIVLTRSDAVAPATLAQLRRCLGRLAPQATLVAAVHTPTSLQDADGNELPLQALAGRKALAFCGIGNPESFFRHAEKLNVELVDRIALDDHAAYPPAVVQHLARAADAGGAEILLTTQKDFVKLAGVEVGKPLWQLIVKMEIVEGREEVAHTIEALSPGKAHTP